MNNRMAEVFRETKETNVKIILNLDGKGIGKISTGIGFFDHMLEQLAHHSGFDLEISCKGDLNVDGHHLVEDVGITLGKVLSKAIDNKGMVQRYGFNMTPMDESLVSIALDISGRPYLFFECQYGGSKVGDLDTQLVEEFFRAFVNHSGITLHIQLIRGSNDHHKIEGIFKGFARAMAVASRPAQQISTTKGLIEGEKI